jgi:hypothetical protein
MSLSEYEEVMTVWQQKEWTCVRDLLVYYNNLDVVPLLEAIQKKAAWYREKNLDMLRDITLPSLAFKLMFQFSQRQVFTVTNVNTRIEQYKRQDQERPEKFAIKLLQQQQQQTPSRPAKRVHRSSPDRNPRPQKRSTTPRCPFVDLSAQASDDDNDDADDDVDMTCTNSFVVDDSRVDDGDRLMYRGLDFESEMKHIDPSVPERSVSGKERNLSLSLSLSIYLSILY